MNINESNNFNDNSQCDEKNQPQEIDANDGIHCIEMSHTQRSDPLKKNIKDSARLDPTRYGDWEKNGRCIDF